MGEGRKARIRVFEVAARDGFQNEDVFIPTPTKIEFINKLSKASFSDIEVGSFVSARWIPQLADTPEVYEAIEKVPGVRYWTLVPNLKGFERAKAVGARWIAVFMSASESHNKKNVNRTVDQSLRELGEVIGEAKRSGFEVRAYLSTVFGCPYEGAVPVARVIRLSARLLEAGADLLSLGDTIGVADPGQVGELVDSLRTAGFPLERMALHFHDTRGTALANVLAGLQAGITSFDAALAGLGGCPYAPGASGNLATEDLLYMLHRMGYDTGVDLDRAADNGDYLQKVINRPLPGRYHAWHMAACRHRIHATTSTDQPGGDLSCRNSSSAPEKEPSSI